ncbi:MAG: YifB family Mg chelatase-like AAA ATPase [Corynebacterium sp.]|nr:YifB family Mg chelatase-like AAA ATPase [Corynebacterium sp.]
MALGVCKTIAIDGVVAHLVTVEANIGRGLPGMHVIGSTDTAISQARSRIRTAASNLGLEWPKTKIVVSMSPAALPKAGAHFDLSLAIAVLSAAVNDASFMPPETLSRRLDKTLFLGEVGLDGSVRPVPGLLSAVMCAQEHGITTLVIPPGNAPEAALIHDLTVKVAHTLKEAFLWAIGETELATVIATSPAAMAPSVDFADIAGQKDAKFAAEVAAAGGHHFMLIGPPGAGKSMIAARMPTILPQLTHAQTIETTAIHSLTGVLGEVIMRAPFIAPHASVTKAALVGGGSGTPRPGAVSLAHYGILFLDEVSEIPAQILDSLRAPLEDGEIRLSRAARTVQFPARFQLMMAANPCRCAAEDPASCTCTVRERINYLKNLSGPLRDRLDMTVHVSGASARINTEGEETSADIAERVAQARERAVWRWSHRGVDVATNAEVPSTFLRKNALADDSAMALISAYLAHGELTQRGVDKILKLAWTLADLRDIDRPDIACVADAAQLRGTGGVHVAV